jgi:hypothetical protein
LWLSPQLRAQLGAQHIVVVGCGGTGSLFAVLAAYVGVHHMTLCDPDVLDSTNLNRYVFASPDAIGLGKADVLADHLRQQVPDVKIVVIRARSPSEELGEEIDHSGRIVVGCVDDVRTRIELDILCRAFGRTLIDLGTGFELDGSGIPEQAGGQVLVSRPDGPCLICLGFTRVCNENDYMIGQNESPQPSLVLLNTVIASLAVECLVREVAGDSMMFNSIDYSRNSLTVSASAETSRYQPCRVCGSNAGRHIESVRRNVRLHLSHQKNHAKH